MAKDSCSRQEIQAWAKTQNRVEPKYHLDGHPKAVDLLKQMLAEVPVGDPIRWVAVRDFVCQRFPDAPGDDRSYKRYAKVKLGRVSG